MSGDTIRRVARRGHVAGLNLGWMVRGEVPAPLVGTPLGDAAPEGQWTRHRWTRLRTAALGLDDYLQDIAAAWERTPIPQDGPVADTSTFAELPALALDERLMAASRLLPRSRRQGDYRGDVFISSRGG